MPYLKSILSWNYWLSTNPAPFMKPVFIGLGVLLILIFLEGAAAKYFAHRSRVANPPLYRILSRWGRAALFLAFAGVFFYFFGYEQVTVLSARFWWLILLAIGIVWKSFIIKDYLKNYKREKAALDEKRAREKYLPK